MDERIEGLRMLGVSQIIHDFVPEASVEQGPHDDVFRQLAFRAGRDDGLAVDCDSLAGHRAFRAACVVALNDHFHRQVEFLGKGKIPRIVCRNGHHRSRSISAQDVVRDPDWDLLLGEGMRSVAPREHSGLARIGASVGPLEVALPLDLLLILLNRLLVVRGGQRREQWMLGRHDDVGDAHDRVRSRREHLDAGIALRHGELYLRADAPPDPRRLRRDGPLWPSEAGQARLQLVGGQAHDGVASALAKPVDDLLVREHGAKCGAPVDERLLLAREAPVEELQEDPLRPAHVVRVGRGDLAIPVVAEAEALQLLLEVGDVLARGHGRVRPGVDGMLLCGQAEGVPPHGMQHVVVPHPPVARHDVAGGVALWMAHVQAGAGWIGEHVQHVLLVLALSPNCAKQLLLLPHRLPLRLHLRVVVSAAAAHFCLARARRHAPPTPASTTLGHRRQRTNAAAHKRRGLRSPHGSEAQETSTGRRGRPHGATTTKRHGSKSGEHTLTPKYNSEAAALARQRIRELGHFGVWSRP
eukprot:scaffold1307_cov200-Pinguiococcus_pyrenoidosus.AAC.65